MQAGMSPLFAGSWNPKGSGPLYRRGFQRDTREQEQVLNMFLLAGVVIWCIGQSSPQNHVPVTSHVTVTARALDQQPRTPPPVFEPEYADVSQESQESFPGDMPF